MHFKREKDVAESAKNISTLRSICADNCTETEAQDLKKLYMNKYGNYMVKRILTVLFTELLMMIAMSNAGIDVLWNGIAYGETIVYGVMWGIGGLYLVVMLVSVILNTYDLKLALDNNKVSKSNCAIEFNEYRTQKYGNKLVMYIKRKHNNEKIWIFPSKSKHRKMRVITNALKSNTGTQLVVYSVDDKKSDLFILVKDKKIEDTADKLIKDMIHDKVELQKLKLSATKAQMTKRKKKKG